MKINKQKIVVVGAGYGGLKAALDLAKHDAFDITIISDTDSFRVYPSLYHTATGGSDTVSSIPLDELIDPMQIVRMQDSVIGIDRALKHVKTANHQEIPYDYLILSLGSITNFFHIEGLQEYAYGIKTLEDAEALKVHLHQQIIDDKKPDLNYVVVGGGPTGVELAGVLGDYVHKICQKHGLKKPKVHIDLVEAAPRVLARLPVSISKRTAKQLKSKGVKLYLNAKVEGQTADQLTVNGKPIRSHTVIWTAGMANNPLFTQQGFQLSRNGKVRVDQYLQAEPSIFVIGDNADTPYSGMAQTAIYDGQYIAHALATIILKKESPKPYVAKKPIYVMPAGPNWAAVQWGSVQLFGRFGWFMRRAADFAGYKDYEPFFKASKRWLAEYEQEDLCAICQPEEARLEHRVAA